MTGAHVIATSSNDAKLARLREMGAAEVINYRSTPGWGKRVLELTAGRGVDQVVEVGGAGTLGNSFEAIRSGGRISLIGLLRGFGGEFNPLMVLFKSVCFQGIRVGSREMFEAMNRAIAAGATASGDRPDVSVRGSPRGLSPSRERRASRQGLHSHIVTRLCNRASPFWALSCSRGCNW